MKYRKFSEMFIPCDDGRAAHLLYDDLKKERTDIPKIAFYSLLLQEYSHLRVKCADGNLGYKLKYIA